MKNLILLAPPAAGKGTLASQLKEKYNYVHISTGDLLRDAVKEGGEFGKEINDMQTKGLLVTDEIVYKLLENRLQKADCKNGYILDGFPRNKEQAKKYDEILEKLNMDLGLVIQLDTNVELLRKRITGRRLCSKCGEIFNINNIDSSPKNENICDKCGAELYQRSDDNEESFNTRYNTYLQKTEPLIDYYKNKNVLYKVDGSEKNKTFNEVEKIIK